MQLESLKPNPVKDTAWQYARVSIFILVAFIALIASFRNFYLVSRHREDMAIVRTVRFDSLWTITSSVHMKDTRTVPTLVSMWTLQERLSTRYPSKVTSVRAAWADYAVHYKTSQSVDWEAVDRLRTTLDSLFNEIEAGTHAQQSWAEFLFVFGALCSFYPLITLRRYLRDANLDRIAKKQVQKAVLLSQERLNHAQALAHIGSWELNLQTNVGTWSDEMYRLHGMRVGEPIPTLTEFVRLVHPEDRDRFNEHCTTFREREIEVRLILPDSTPRTMRTVVDVERDENGEPLFVRGTSLDITAQKQAEEAIQRALAFNVGILNGADYSIISTATNGVITTFNRGAERLLGYTANEIVNKSTLGILHDVGEVFAYADELTAELGETIEPGFEVFVAKARLNLPEEREWTYIRKDGSRVPVLLSVSALRDSEGNLTGFLGIANDITERKQIE